MNLRKKYHDYIRFKVFFLCLLLLGLVVIALFSLTVGSSDLTIRESIETIFGQSSPIHAHIVFQIRLPRIIGGFFVGMSIALSGMIIQSSLNNPLASPSTLGISSASAFGANLAIILLTKLGFEASAYLTGLSSFLAAMGCMLLILGVGNWKVGGKSTLLLLGVAFNSLFIAATTILQYFADESQLASAVSWTFGDLGRIDYREIQIVFAVTLVSALLIYRLRWKYNAMDMGESTAHSLGVNTRTLQNLSILIAALNTGVNVAFVGMIGFVGLIAPQVTKRFIGEDKRFLLPGSLLMGAFIVLLSDTIARTVVAPLVLPVGAITSIVGAPLFVYILLKEK